MLNIFNKLKPNYDKKVAFLLILVFCIILFSVAYIFVSADEVTFAGGDGTSSSPYQIENCSQLQLVASTTYISSKYFIVNNDIDCATTTSWNSGAGFLPIGTLANKFTGNFNGNGYKISNLFINRTATDYVGLFGYNNGYISNIKLVDANISGKQYTGGIAGFNTGTITRSSNYYLDNYSNSKVSGTTRVGGLVGQNDTAGSITESYAIANTVSSGSLTSGYAGGFVGYNLGTISNSYARGAVNGTSSGYRSGFAGYHGTAGNISNSYATAVVGGTGTYITGFSGYPTTGHGTVSNSFWDINVSGKTTSVGGTGTTTVPMKTSSTFTNVGWNFAGTWSIDTAKNNGYPYLANNDSGNDPVYEIYTAEDLRDIKDNPSGRYIQMANIDASTTTSWNSGLGFLPIPIFYGQYDGNGYNVTNLYINRSTTDYIGVFAENRGYIDRIKLIDSNFTGKNYVGSVAGSNRGIIEKSANYFINDAGNEVSGVGYVGGLVGQNDTTGIITESYAIANTLSSGSLSSGYAGGFVGYNLGIISNSYVRGTVNGTSNGYRSGFAGYHGTTGNISKSYATAVVGGTGTYITGFSGYPTTGHGTVSNSFWDINVSGKTTSVSGTGTTTVPMKTSSTFTNVSWDFSGTWIINSAKNNGYPYLTNNDPGNDPVYEIYTAEDLRDIKDNPSGRFIQMANIDASTTTSWNSGLGFLPIPIFYGQYDGNGYNITNLYINRSTTDYIGVFAENRGHVDRIKLIDSNFIGKNYVGSVAGSNRGTIQKSANYFINDSDNRVSGVGYVGGLVGQNDTTGIITESYVVANTLSSGNLAFGYTGGFVGYNIGTISNSYTRGSVDNTGSGYRSGFAGYHGTGGNISKSYAAAVVSGSSGGFTLQPTTGHGTVSNSFWDIDVSGQGSSAAGSTGTTTEAMKTESTFTAVSWDFNGIWTIDPAKNNRYPYLDNNDPGEDPVYEIYTVEDLQAIENNPSGRFIQMANIDASTTTSWNGGAGFEPITVFNGQYNGNGKTITGLVINRSSTDYVAIFAENIGYINKMKLIDSNFTGRDYVGSIVGNNRGTIERSANYFINDAANEVSGVGYVGGLVGQNDSTGIITESYAIANSVSSGSLSYGYAGGFVGYNAGTISNSYARGSVDGATGYRSGFAGYHGTTGNISNSYAAAVVSGLSGGFTKFPTSGHGTVSNSFWDIDVSGQASSAAGSTGTTTVAMKTESTFTDVGWDFIGTWYLYDNRNDGYPSLDPIYLYAMQSRNWRIKQDSINFYGGYGASDSYKMEDTGGEIGTGWSTSTTYTMHAGYQQMDEDMFISLTMSTSTVLSPSVNGLSGGTATGSNEIIVATNVSAGYTLEIKASTSPALHRVSSSDGFSDYTTSSTDPDFAWQIENTAGEFGFSIESVDAIQRYLNNGSDTCNQAGGVSTANTCWDNFSTSAKTLSQSSLGDRDGKTTILNLRAESGSQNVQPSGAYQAELTVTAYVN